MKRALKIALVVVLVYLGNCVAIVFGMEDAAAVFTGCLTAHFFIRWHERRKKSREEVKNDAKVDD